MTGVIHAMTNGISGHRRRAALSISAPVHGVDPVGRLDQVAEILHQINRALPRSALGREELIAIGGLLSQVSGALLTLTELLGAPAQHCDRTRAGRADAGADSPGQPATAQLRDCRSGFAAAQTSARAFHAGLRRDRCSRASGGLDAR